MKKIIISLIILLLAVGCAKKTSNLQETIPSGASKEYSEVVAFATNKCGKDTNLLSVNYIPTGINQYLFTAGSCGNGNKIFPVFYNRTTSQIKSIELVEKNSRTPDYQPLPLSKWKISYEDALQKAGLDNFETLGKVSPMSLSIRVSNIQSQSFKWVITNYDKDLSGNTIVVDAETGERIEK